MCHVSCVMCHVSHVTCQYFFLIGQCVGAGQWRVGYQRGLPRLVLPWPLPERQAMVVWPVVTHKGVTDHLTEQTRTDMSAIVCHWSRVVDLFMTVSIPSHDCLMTVS